MTIITKENKELMMEMPNRGEEYLKWIDTKPLVFQSFYDWMFTYYPDEWREKFF